MELTFNNNDSVYVSEFKVDSDFNLHVERDELGKFVIWVKTTPVGNYAKVNHEENLDDLYVIDYNFTGTVYPKYIKIVSKVEPTYAAITTDGEVTEIKTQSKEIEITSNGITNITPDSGFAYLDRVSVKTNVPTSGGGSEDTMEYFILKDAGEYGEVLGVTASYFKAQITNDPVGVMIVPVLEATKGFIEKSELPIAVGVDFESKILALQDDTTMEMTMMDYASAMGAPVDGIANIPRITKEEFFTLPKNVTVNYQDQEKLKEVYESIVDLYIRRGLPIYGRTREAIYVDEPLVYFNYRSLAIYRDEYNYASPEHLSYYGVAQEYDGYNNWYDIAMEDVASCDMLLFDNCWIYKLTRTNGKVVYTFGEMTE